MIRYKKFGKGLLMLEKAGENIALAKVQKIDDKNEDKVDADSINYFDKGYASASNTLKVLYDKTEEFICSIGDDVTAVKLKYYMAFKKIKNFASVEIRSKTGLVIFLKLDAASIKEEQGFIRDVTDIGHLGTGNIELSVKNDADLEKAKSLIEMAYREN